jgi:hypothetical protein
VDIAFKIPSFIEGPQKQAHYPILTATSALTRCTVPPLLYIPIAGSHSPDCRCEQSQSLHYWIYFTQVAMVAGW